MLTEPVPEAPARAVRRYLAAFGSASVADMQTWSGLTRLRETAAAMDLRTYRDENGTVLYDLPEATLPGPDPRLLPEYDNLLFSYKNRTRVLRDEYRSRVWRGNQAYRPVLLDGFVRGIRRPDRGRASATIEIEPFAPLTCAEREAVEAESVRLLQLSAPDVAHDVRFVL